MHYEFDTSGKLKSPDQAELEAADQNSHILVCNYGINDNGRPYWIYLAVKPSKYAELMQRTQEHQHICFQDYGTILKCSIGEEVPANIKTEMERQYGCDDNYMKKQADDVHKQQTSFIETQEKNRLSNIVNMLKNKTDD